MSYLSYQMEAIGVSLAGLTFDTPFQLPRSVIVGTAVLVSVRCCRCSPLTFGIAGLRPSWASTSQQTDGGALTFGIRHCGRVGVQLPQVLFSLLSPIVALARCRDYGTSLVQNVTPQLFILTPCKESSLPVAGFVSCWPPMPG